MKSKHTIILGGLLTAIALTGCVIEKPGESGQSSFVEQEIEIGIPADYDGSIGILIPSGNENEQTMIDAAIEAFKLKYPKVNISTTFVTISTYESQVRQMHMAERLPDIVWTNSQEVYFLRSLNVIEPLNNYINASEARGDYDFEADFKTEFFDMAGDGDLYYAVPRSADTVVTFYNKKLLSDAGISMDKIKNGWTWDDFLSICAQWRTHADALGHAEDWFCADFNMSWSSVYYPFMRSYGADIFQAENTIGVDTQAMRDALAAMRDLADKRYCVGAGVTSGSSFESATCPFIFQSAAISHYDNMRALKGNIDIVTFPIINGEQGKIGAGIAGYSLTSASKEKLLSWEFLNFLMSYDGQQALASGGLNLPSIRNDLADPDNTDANWTKGYTDRNLEAYVLYDERKIADEYYSYIDPSAMADVTLAIGDVVGDTLSTSSNRPTIDKIIENAIEDLEYAIND